MNSPSDDPAETRAPVSAVARIDDIPLDLASRHAAERIVRQVVTAERRRRVAYWAVFASMAAAALYNIVETQDERNLWILGGLASAHLVLNLWVGVHNRARLTLEANREVLDEAALIEAAELVRRDRITPETALREVGRRRSLRAA